MHERAYQAKLIKKLRLLFPGCIILKNDPGYIQGIPDLIILYGPCWGMLEVKASDSSSTTMSQLYYVERLNNMSFAAFICPENEQEVLDALQFSFESCRNTRVS